VRLAWGFSCFLELEVPHTVERFAGEHCGCTLCSARSWAACIMSFACVSPVLIFCILGGGEAGIPAFEGEGVLPTT
jgi:hypothetical protein